MLAPHPWTARFVRTFFKIKGLKLVDVLKPMS